MGRNNDCLHRTCWLKKSRPFLLEKGSFQLSPNILRYIALTDHLLRTQANLKIHHAILDASSSASSQVLKKHETVRLELQSQVICFILQSFVRKRDEELYDDNITTKTKLYKKNPTFGCSFSKQNEEEKPLYSPRLCKPPCSFLYLRTK